MVRGRAFRSGQVFADLSILFHLFILQKLDPAAIPNAGVRDVLFIILTISLDIASPRESQF